MYLNDPSNLKNCSAHSVFVPWISENRSKSGGYLYLGLLGRKQVASVCLSQWNLSRRNFTLLRISWAPWFPLFASLSRNGWKLQVWSYPSTFSLLKFSAALPNELKTKKKIWLGDSQVNISQNAAAIPQGQQLGPQRSCRKICQCLFFFCNQLVHSRHRFLWFVHFSQFLANSKTVLDVV